MNLLQKCWKWLSPRKALLRSNLGYLCGWVLSKNQKLPASWMIKTRTKGLVRIKSNDFSMNFIWAASNVRVYEIMDNKGSYKSKEFKFYLWQLIDLRWVNPELDKISLIMIYVNARIHISDEVKEFKMQIKTKIN